MQLRLIIFVSFMTLITIFGARWVGKRLITDSHFHPHVKTALWSLLIVMVSSIIITQWLYRLAPTKDPTPSMTLLYWFAFTSMGALPTLFVLTFFRELSLLAFDGEKRTFAKNFLNLGALGLSVAGTGFGLYQARSLPRVNRVRVPITGLDPKLDGLKIAQLTDVHIGPTIRGEHLSGIVDITNSLKPDLIALTGDFVDGTIPQLEAQLVAIKRLEAPYGKFYITGNHEYYWGARAWVNHFQNKLGCRALQNEHVTLDVRGKKFLVAGVNDLHAEQFFPEDKCDPARAMKNAPAHSDFKLLLAHQPKVCEMTDGKSFDLQLSGHTHAGQFWPITMVIHFFHKYVKGLYRYESMWLYVSPATCYWGPPNRLFNPAEITLIELSRA